MAIDPVNSTPPTTVDPTRADATAKGKSAGHVHHGGGKGKKAESSDQSDTLALSDTAATLPTGDVIPSGELTATELQSITQRLANGDYNSSAGIDRLATALISNGVVGSQG